MSITREMGCITRSASPSYDMKNKNRSRLKWALGAILLLMAIPLANPQFLNHLRLPTLTELSRPGRFMDYLENLFNMYFHSATTDLNAVETELNTINQLLQTWGHVPRKSGYVSPSAVPSVVGLNAKATQGNNPTAQQASNPSQTENTLETPNTPDTNATNNAETNTDTNAANNASSNAEQSIESTGAGSQGDNTQSNNGNNADNNAANNPAGNTELNATIGSGEGSSNNGTGAATSGSDQGTGGSSNNNSGSGSASDLPTINPIPTDDQAATSIAKQNQQNDSLTAELARRQALITPVQEQAQANKYQTIPPTTSIPTPSANPPPSDTAAKVQSKQYSFH